VISTQCMQMVLASAMAVSRSPAPHDRGRCT
jgi:hypothetical protein